MSASPPKPVTVTLLNYRKDGSPFWNALHIAPVRDAEGVLEYFIGVQLDVTQQQEQEHKTVQQAAAAAPVDEHAAGRVVAVRAGWGCGAGLCDIGAHQTLSHSS
jgi:hypothetical protein